ncbi:MAG: adenylate/guanylate cyclase domain-containing protein [Geminicoccaceae bacterium]
MAEPRAQRRLAAIQAADVVGYSRRIGADEAGTLAALRAVWAERFNPPVAAHRGRVVKMMGDGALVEFASAVDAVEAAVAIQQAMAAYNEERPGAEPMLFRIGVNLGDVVVEGDDILGDGVNVAARLEAQAPPGGMLVSDSVRAQIRGKVGLELADGGLLALKNIEAPVHVWRWGGDVDTPAAAPVWTGPELPSLAVLPFAAVAGDAEQEAFADGLVEDIITTLSKLAGLRVVARNSTFVYKGQAVDIREVGRRLGVRYVLEGSVRRAGSRMRITAQLIEAGTGSHVWAERYDRTLDDIFAVQDELTLTLATEMQVNLTEGEQARLHYTTTSNVAAWNHWVKGRALFRKAVTKENFAAALALWKQALALEPSSASLTAMVGFMHWIDARFGWWDDRATALAKLQGYAQRALELDPENADACTTSSFASLLQRRYEEAAERARRAVALAPGSADAATLACFVLAFTGHPEEAVALGRRSLELSPVHPGYYLGHLGNALRLAGRFEEAIPCFETYHAMSPGFGLVDLVLSHARLGRADRARQAAAELMQIRPGFTIAGWADTQLCADAEGLAADLALLRAVGLPEG